jgi:hypothetical protein
MLGTKYTGRRAALEGIALHLPIDNHVIICQIVCQSHIGTELDELSFASESDAIQAKAR